MSRFSEFTHILENLRMMKTLLKWILPLSIMLIAGGVSYYWMENKPRADRKPPEKNVPLVELVQPVFKDHQLTVHAMGNVVAAQLVNLTSRISGMVIATSPNFIEGGILKKSEEIVQLDPTDYKLVIAQRESELEKARFNLKLEQGQQQVALREYQLLGTKLDDKEKELVLRKPHLKAAKAQLEAAKAALKQAQLDLKRTRTISPFNAIVLSRNANIGSWVSTFSTGTPLVRLAGTDNFWIDVSLPVDRLRWIDIPGINSDKGAKVRISYKTGWGEGVYRYGHIKRLKAEVESEGRMAKLIVEVNDPLSQKPENKDAPPLMLGTFVRLEIEGHIFQNVAALPESLLHDGDTLWLMDKDGRLQLHHVEPAWRELGNIYLSPEQLPENARVVSSELSTPVQGMSLRDAKTVAKDKSDD